MGSYRKTIEADTFQHRFYEALGFPPASDDSEMPLVIRITLGDMELLDGFYMSLPADAGSLSIEDAIRKYVLCESEEDRIEVKRKLARDPNPDLLDIYNALLCLCEQAETGALILSYNINNGASDVQPTDPVNLHQCLCTANGRLASTYMLLDLVLEVCDNLDPFSGITDQQKDAMLEDFRRIFILYLMDKFGYQPVLHHARQEEESSRLESWVLGLSFTEHLSTILESLALEDVGLIRSEGEYYITPRGYDVLNSIINEAEFYIDNYDIFGDVYIKGISEIRFNTGYGDDLIVPVFIRQGIDPFRALFAVALYLGNMDDLASDLDMLFSEDPFKELFSLIARSPTEEDIGKKVLDQIIREGSLKIEERKLREARLEHIKSIEQRINNF